jgi:putative intracellular protease/amidase
MADPFIVVFPIYAGLTQLDFTGPYEVLSRLPGARAIVASVKGGLVESETGLTFVTEKLADIASCDLICVPGGPGQTEAALGDPAYMAEVRRLGAGAKWLTSVCSGSLILGAAGLIRDRRAACHWAWLDLLPMFGAVPADERVVRDGNLITGGGVTAGIDFALTVAAEIAGPKTAQAIQLMLQYAPEPPFDAGHPKTAPDEVLAIVKDRIARSFPGRKAAAERAMART